MTCPGIVTNVTNFGAFVDVGVHHDGLVHISQLGDRFVKDPRTAVKPGDRVEVRVLKVDLDKRQISLTMRKASSRAAEAPPEGRPASAPRGASPARPNAARPNRPAHASRRREGRRPRQPPEQAEASGRDAKPGPRPPTSKPAPPPPRQKPAFNNPFAVLARLKDPGKS